MRHTDFKYSKIEKFDSSATLLGVRISQLRQIFINSLSKYTGNKKMKEIEKCVILIANGYWSP